MPSRAAIEARLLERTDALVAAARRRMYLWIRQKVSLEEILRRITQLPVNAELKKLEDELRKQMEQLYRSQNIRPGQMAVDAIIAKTDLFTPNIRSDVRRTLRHAVEKAIDEKQGVEGLKRTLDDLQLSGTMTLANTSIAGFNNLLTIEQAKVAQIDTFLYDGPTGPVTRPFCLARVGKVYTLQQLRGMDNGQDLPVEQYLGGYNCRHFLTAVLPEEILNDK